MSDNKCMKCRGTGTIPMGGNDGASCYCDCPVGELKDETIKALGHMLGEKEAELTKLKPDSWISVDDRLPIEGKHVQMFSPHIQHTGYYGGLNVGWVINSPRLPKVSRKITHWMPLPEPPTTREAIQEAIKSGG